MKRKYHQPPRDNGKYVAYYRMSALRNHNDGSKQTEENSYGLASQKEMVHDYVAAQKGEIIGEFQEVQSGMAHNRHKRVEVLKAVELAKQHDATLVFPYVDRVARDMEFVGWLVNTGLRLRFADNPNATELVIYVLGAVAEDRSKSDSKKIKRGIDQRRKKGLPIGCHAHKNPGAKWTDEHRKKAVEVLRERRKKDPANKAAANRAFALWLQGYRPLEVHAILIDEGYRGPNGGALTWYFMKTYLYPQIDEFKQSGNVQPAVRKLVSKEFLTNADVPEYIGPRRGGWYPVYLKDPYLRQREIFQKEVIKAPKDKYRNFTNEKRAEMGLPKKKRFEYKQDKSADRNAVPKTRMRVELDPQTVAQNYINPPLVDPKQTSLNL